MVIWQLLAILWVFIVGIYLGILSLTISVTDGNGSNTWADFLTRHMTHYEY